MPRVHYVNRARKTYYGTGIKKGEFYFWWKFRYGAKQRSKIKPLASQLTQSPFWGVIYNLQELFVSPYNDPETVQAEIDEAKEKLEELRDETQEKLDNQPESMSDGPIAELLRSRVEAMEEVISILENLDPEDEPESAWQEACDAVSDISCE